MSFSLARRGAAALLAMVVIGSRLFASFEDRLVIRGGRLFQGTAAAGSQEIGALVISGDRIVEILPKGAAIPGSARTIDAAGCTLLPGLFDLHTHVSVPGGMYAAVAGVTPETNLASHLFCGVTHVVDLHGDESTIFALRDASRGSAGMARLYAAGGAFTMPKGHGTQFGIPANVVTSVKEVGDRFTALLPKKPDVIKAIVEHGGWGGLPAMPALSEDLVSAIGARSKAAKLPLYCHVWNLEEALTAARSGARALAHGVFLGKVDDRLITEMKSHGTAYVPTMVVVLASTRTLAGKPPYGHELAKAALHPDLYAAITDPEMKTTMGLSPMARLGADQESQCFANLKALADAGVEIGLGTDAGNPLVPHGPGVLFELSLYVDAGLTPAQALEAATRGSARILGVDDRFGTLEKGKIADVVIVRGDPIRSISDVWNVETVIKSGVLVDRSAMAARNRESARPAVAVLAGSDVPAQIDGFDDGDLASDWGGRWVFFGDSVAPNGKSSGQVERSTVDGATVLRVKGTVAEGFTYGAWAGAMLRIDPDGKRVVDASKHTGLKLRVRGTPRPYSLTVNCAAVKDFNVFNVPLSVTSKWAEVEVPFASLQQIGFGKPVTFTAKDLTGFNIDARNFFMGQPTYGDFLLEIDWIRVY